MFKSYMMIAIRNIKQYKAFSFINILGLSIGIACCILIFLWIQDELGYDRFHENADEIYRVIKETQISGQVSHFATSPNAIGPILKETYPEIINATRFQSFDHALVQYGEKSFLNDRLGTADPSFFEMFTFPFLKGSPETALNDRYSIVVTEGMAKKYFGHEEPIGKVIKINHKDFKVTGVIKDIPRNSHMQFCCILPIINMKDWWHEDLDSWERARFINFIQLQKGSPGTEVSQKISNIIKKYLPQSNTSVYLQPLTDIHLHSDFQADEDNIGKGSITYVYIFSTIAFCILLIACINFMNLSTARSGSRAREVGLRKVVGANRTNMVKQFLGETIFLSFIALLFAVILAYLFLPVFNNLAQKHLTIDFSGNIPFTLALFVITLLTGIISGIYPALFLSSFQPVTVLKGTPDIGKRRGSFLRKFLVVAQFTFAIVLFIGIIVIYNQLQYVKTRDLGFDKDHVIYFWGQGGFVSHAEYVKNELLQNTNILSVTKASPPISTFSGVTAVDWQGKNPQERVVMYPVLTDYDYLKTFNIKMVQGRFFSKKFPTDVSNYVVNESAAKLIGVQSPVGMRFYFDDGWAPGNREGTLIGVIKNFHQDSLHKEIPPLVLRLHADAMFICVRFKPQNIPDTIKFLESKWEKFVGGGYPFSYEFLDETVDNFYKKERRIGKILRYSTFLAIFISCLGILGLVLFMVEQKTKEIGIRKILGASVSGILFLISKEFMKWIIIALIIACPVAWYAMNRWLQNFAYRASIEWWMFLLAGGTVLIIALLTVSHQSIKAAYTDPVDTLRYE